MTTINLEIDSLTLSHSLRIPLTEIMGMVELLKRDQLTMTQKEEVEAIQEASNRLLKMVDIILTAQIEESKPLLYLN
ncbi:MAG TPA: histidine kinase dimerization/phospho-acceptor domain-containing protein [Gammaproteobacteria bacterium]|jgi:signal transduction histidine kinase|nr:histidine kinase dimerization/phospho-acceptor domain-containing protein [Gammaproteobacteria bacterium]